MTQSYDVKYISRTKGKEMTHQELLAKIDELRKNNISQEISNDAECMALRKIIELHSPRGTEEWTYCQVCHNNNEYPCATLKIIEKALQ